MRVGKRSRSSKAEGPVSSSLLDVNLIEQSRFSGDAPLLVLKPYA
jgi:hypothetical protein